MLAFAGQDVAIHGWRTAVSGGFFRVLLAVALARACYWGARRRRNRVEVRGTQVRVVIRGKCTDFEASDIRKLDWSYGFWSLTLDPGENTTGIGLTLSDGRQLDVDLWLPRKREQRKAFQRLAEALPPTEWTVRWPYSVLPKKKRVWHPADGRVPR